MPKSNSLTNREFHEGPGRHEHLYTTSPPSLVPVKPPAHIQQGQDEQFEGKVTAEVKVQ